MKFIHYSVCLNYVPFLIKWHRGVKLCWWVFINMLMELFHYRVMAASFSKPHTNARGHKKLFYIINVFTTIIVFYKVQLLTVNVTNVSGRCKEGSCMYFSTCWAWKIFHVALCNTTKTTYENHWLETFYMFLLLRFRIVSAGLNKKQN